MPPQLGDARRPRVGGDHQAVGRDRARVGVGDGGGRASESPHQRVLVHAPPRPGMPAAARGRGWPAGSWLRFGQTPRPGERATPPDGRPRRPAARRTPRDSHASSSRRCPSTRPCRRRCDSSTANLPRTIWVSICCSRQKASISSIARSDSRQMDSATSALTSFRSDGNFAHQDSTKPPLRLDAPPPQMSRSSTTTSQSGAELLDPPRRPQSHEAASDDAHVGGGRLGQRRRVRAVVEGLFQPERAVWCGGGR